MVKLVTEASATVCGFKKRHAFILNTLESRKEMPKIVSKKSFFKNVNVD